MTALQKISQEAKRIYKANPNLSWTECIKRASLLYTKKKKNAIVKKVKSIPTKAKKIAIKKAKAGAKSVIKKIYKSKILNGTKTTATKKADSKNKIGYESDRIDQLKKTTPYIRKYKKEGFSRKDAIKNAMLDAGYMSGTKTHKDTKSHNVNIRVVSGIDLQPYYENLDTLYSRLDDTQEYYKYLQKQKPTERYTKTHITTDLKLTREKIQFLKDQIKSFREIIIRATKKL